ncbi:transcription termination factor MTERF2, chloroplastic-like isoform X4 [Telopea speciosissima]|uniref:transcription termination factor MTERF2, chloroplastic-like isoform X4 n=1 Tax=Telopea speciosissima TaxID=54955 RepID=UPI001CC6C13F|nr:transcription termination factor MTERF2, chloroplastic-like isoform X4 [Telopea speciosissima]
MLRFFCKTVLLTKAKDSRSSQALFLRTISSTESTSGTLGSIDQKNLTISYLMNSCGLPFKAAISTAQKIRIETTERPDSVIELLQTNGFTKAHMANLITKYPPLLFVNPVKTLKPKIEFFQSLGFSRSDLARLLSSDKSILLRSLQKQIIPTLNYLKTFVHTNENLVSALKRCSSVVGCNVKRILEPNIATLRSYGVPDSNILRMITLHPKLLTVNVYRFKDVAATVNKMGFDPNGCAFIIAIFAMSMVSKQKWEKKREVFRSFGWSDEEFLLAFKLQPMVMLTSEKKLVIVMDFFVKDLHLKPSAVAKYPNLFLVSLERRIIPRCSVLQVLMSKGHIEKDLNIFSALICNKQPFDKRFVTRYEGEVPEVIKAYKGEMGFLGFDS